MQPDSSRRPCSFFCQGHSFPDLVLRGAPRGLRRQGKTAGFRRCASRTGGVGNHECWEAGAFARRQGWGSKGGEEVWVSAGEWKKHRPLQTTEQSGGKRDEKRKLAKGRSKAAAVLFCKAHDLGGDESGTRSNVRGNWLTQTF